MAKTNSAKVFRGERLRTVREQMSLSQDELAEALGLGQAQINRYEQNKNDPSSETLVAMARYLGVTTDYLLGLVDSPSQHMRLADLTDEEREIFDTLQQAARLIAVRNKKAADTSSDTPAGGGLSGATQR
jgi:transcriptional regulator with XRE-family HTH domain